MTTFADNLLKRHATMADARGLFHTLFSSAAPLELGTWTPTYGAGGSMTYTSVTTEDAYYVQIGEFTFYVLDAYGTTGGTTSNTITFSLPTTASYDGGSPIIGNGWCDGVATAQSCYVRLGSGVGNLAQFERANMTLQVDFSISILGFYRTA